MNTFVRREILDKSISGDKIFGGEINWIDGLYTDYLAVPHTGISGTGSIDGSAFTIGLSERILYMEAGTVGAGSLFVWSSDFGHIAATIQPSATQYGSLRLNSASGLNVFLTANISSRSYHLPPLVVGSSSQIGGYALEVPGAAWMGYIYGEYAGYTSGSFLDLYFENHDAVYSSIKTYTQLVERLTPCLAGGIGPLLEDSLLEIVDNVSAWQMSQIVNLQDAITTDNWYSLSEMDQLVSIGSNVAFGNVNCVDVIATGDISGSNITGDKFIETGGNIVFVDSLFGEKKGLHLDWHRPLVPTTTGVRIVVHPGICTNSDKAVRMSLATKKTKLINSAFVVGDGGGMPTSIAPVQPSTNYYVILIWDPVGPKVAVGFDTFSNGANLKFDANTIYGWSEEESIAHRVLGLIHTNASSKIDLFEDIDTVPAVPPFVGPGDFIRSGFKLFGTGLTTSLEVYAGAEKFGDFAKIWIEDGSGASNTNAFKYTFATGARPSSIDGLNAPSSAPCNFYCGEITPDKVRQGEIVLSNSSNEFICKVYGVGLASIEDTMFVNDLGLKGLRDLTTFTLYLSKDT